MELNVKCSRKSAAMLCAAAGAVCWLSARSFMSMWKPEVLVPAPGFEEHMLSRWEPALAKSPGDTPVFIQDSGVPGGTLFVMGGIHANEPAGYMAAVVCLERAHVEKGRLIVMPFANMSARSHNAPQDAAPQYIHFKTDSGAVRTFRFGARSTNFIHQWPNPNIYVHYPSGQKLDGSSRSNQNRAFPGTLHEALTQRVAYAITELLKKEDVDLAFDLHEAAPEYPVVNAMVAHERSMELAAEAVMELEMNEIPMRLEPSPKNLRGLSHREWGDAIPHLKPFLLEAGNPSQGRLRGRTDEHLVLTGQDKAFFKAASLGRLFIPYKGSQSIEMRTFRHLAGIGAVLKALNDSTPERGVVISGIPEYDEGLSQSLGHWLNDVKKSLR